MTQMITARYDLAKTVEAIAATRERSHGKLNFRVTKQVSSFGIYVIQYR